MVTIVFNRPMLVEKIISHRKGSPKFRKWTKPFDWEKMLVGEPYWRPSSNGVTLLSATYRISDLACFADWNGNMISWRIKKFIFKVSTMSRSNLFRCFCKEKVFFFNYVPKTPLWNYFEMFIIYWRVTVRTEKLYLRIYQE